jgi:2-polyprenyl-3-methyl-5-hydroxy-6-metoxy-1,4-benzoquinol methylase
VTTDSTLVPSAESIDEDRLNQFVHQFVTDLGATVHAANVVIGDKLGLYKGLAEAGPSTPGELAGRTGTSTRYVAEWLAGQAAGGYVSYRPATGRFHLSPEQAFALADEQSPAFMPGAFQLACASVRDEPKITEAFRTGAGVGWHEHNHDVFEGCERFFRPGYAANVVAAWIPALDGVEAKLVAGARVADIGCGHGASTVLMAQAYPASTFVGFDYHDASVEQARRRAEEAGVADRCRFEVASASSYPGTGYDLVTSFDCLHDMGDPVAAATHVRHSLAADGAWMLVEPNAGDAIEDNLNPVGRTYYGFSTLLCVPNSLSQETGAALGAQAGEARLRDVVTSAGFRKVQVATRTPLNLVIEVRA